MKEFAIRYPMMVLSHAIEWHEGQGALSNHPQYGPWIRDSGTDEIDFCQPIIRRLKRASATNFPTVLKTKPKTAKTK